METTQLPQENHETLKVSTSPDPHHSPKMLLIGLAALLIIITASGIGYFLGTNNQGAQQATSPNQNTLTQIKTGDQSQLNDPTPQPGISARKISYARISGWSDYNSNTGYSLQYPPHLKPSDSGELWYNNGCHMNFANGVSATVLPYDGGSRRVLLGNSPGYNASYEEVEIQGSKSLIRELAPVGESGSGSSVVIPVGKNALIVSWDYTAKDSPEFQNLLSSIKITDALNLAKCARTTEDVTFSGTITDIYYGCIDVYGVCTITVDSNKQVQVAKANNTNKELTQEGQLIGLTLNQSDKQKFIGKKVEVFAKGPYTNSCSIFEDSKYYVKVTE